MQTASPYLELLDWRRRVADLFHALRARDATRETLTWFRAEKDTLFRVHPQSPLPAEQRRRFAGLPYWDHDPAMRVTARLTPTDGERYEGEVSFVRIGDLAFQLHGQDYALG